MDDELRQKHGGWGGWGALV